MCFDSFCRSFRWLNEKQLCRNWRGFQNKGVSEWYALKITEFHWFDWIVQQDIIRQISEILFVDRWILAGRGSGRSHWVPLLVWGLLWGSGQRFCLS